MSHGQNNEILNRIEAEIPRLRRYARSLVRDAEGADDLVQDCLVRAVANIGSWKEGTNLRAWLMTILRNKFFNDCRKKKRERNIFMDQGSTDVGVVPAQQDAQLYMASFESAFQKLSQDHREALLLVAVEGYPYDQAAKILDISIGTVKSRVSRARASLRTQLDQIEGTELRQPC